MLQISFHFLFCNVCYNQIMNNVTISISTETMIKAVVVFLGTYLLWLLRDLVLIVLASIVIGSAISPMAGYLLKFKVPRTLSILIVYILFFVGFFSVMYFFIPPVLQQTSSLLATLPTTLEGMGVENNLSFIDTKSLAEPVKELNTLFANLKEDSISLITTVFGGLMSFVLIVVLSFYFAVNEKGVEDFLRMITPLSREKFVLNLWKRAQKKMGLWLQGQLLLGLIVGVLVFLGLTVMGVPYALALAFLAGIMELIPVFGPFLSAAPAVALAFSTSGFTFALIVAIFYLIVQQFENNLIYPLVVTKVVGVPPLLVILALVAGGMLAGVIGVLLAVPVAAVLQEVFSELDKLKHKEVKQTK